MQRTGAVLNTAWVLQAPGVWLVFVGAATMASQGQVIFWRYGIICVCFGTERGEGTAFSRLLDCITLLPGAFKSAFLCSLTLSCYLNTRAASFTQSVRPCSCQTLMHGSLTAARMDMCILETLHGWIIPSGI